MIARFFAVIALLAAGSAWTMFIAAPALVGVPATWENAPMLFIAAPGLLMFLAALIVEVCNGRP